MRHRELRIIAGKKVFELQPNIEWDNGEAVLWLLKTLGLEHGNALPIYIGDDCTDEDAFRVLERRGVPILVSEQPQVTAATYWLKNPQEVERFLRELVARCLDSQGAAENANERRAEDCPPYLWRVW